MIFLQLFEFIVVLFFRKGVATRETIRQRLASSGHNLEDLVRNDVTSFVVVIGQSNSVITNYRYRQHLFRYNRDIVITVKVYVVK